MDMDYDVVVIGGGAAGLSGALALARARRSVLVVDAGEPRNAPADAVHNYLGREGTSPAVLLADGRAEVAGYCGTVLESRVLDARTLDGGVSVTLEGGRQVTGRRVLVTTGLLDELPDVGGLAERWGRDVLHCPYCHGWEVRDRPIGVLAAGPLSVTQALLWRQWSSAVTLFRHTGPEPSDQERARLAARGITVVEDKVAELEVTDDHLTGVRLVSGEVVACEALVVAPLFTARSELLESLGVEATEQVVGGQLVGTAAVAAPTGATGVPGVWVAGNVADLRAGTINAAAAGLSVAAAMNADLVTEDTDRAVAHAALERFWDEHYGASGRGGTEPDQRVWSGRANPLLVEMVADQAPGRALDLGAGEGGDAIWLAGRGWRVTAVDVSAVALERLSTDAATAGVDVAVERHDLAESFPDGTFDLVSAQYLHSPVEFPRERVLRRAAQAVAPGGLLLVVGHGKLGPWGWHLDLVLPTPDEVLRDLGLDLAEWRVERRDSPARTATGPHGEQAEVTDHVLAVRRLV